jgi:hypothetical protein
MARRSSVVTFQDKLSALAKDICLSQALNSGEMHIALRTTAL